MKKYTAVDLFSGAGGLSEGFGRNSFEILAANDFDYWSAQTFVANHPNTHFVPGPVQHVTGTDLLSSSGLERGELDVLLGGPPCQAFSVYNHQRGVHDERSGLFREYLRLVDELLPRIVVIENVTGITSVEGGWAVDEIQAGLGRLGYDVDVRVLRAEDFGVPQERRRIFFIGRRDGVGIQWPEPVFGDRGLGPIFMSISRPFVTVSEAIGDLPTLNVGEGEEVSLYDRVAWCDYQFEMRAGSDRVYNHVAPQLQNINIERMKHIPQGGSWRDIPFELLPNGMKTAKRSDHTKRYGRLHPGKLSSTILTKCDLHWGAYIHPSQDRTITVREAARFQSFPDRFQFLGPRSEQFKQVGNAVPPRLAYEVSVSVRSMLNEMDALIEDLAIARIA